MRNLILSLGLKIIDPDPKNTHKNIQRTLEEVIKIYEQSMMDANLKTAAYGIAIGGVSIALNVTLRTAKLLVDHALAIRSVPALK
jgi:hypothetical protein